MRFAITVPQIHWFQSVETAARFIDKAAQTLITDAPVYFVILIDSEAFVCKKRYDLGCSASKMKSDQWVALYCLHITPQVKNRLISCKIQSIIEGSQMERDTQSRPEACYSKD